MSELPKGWETTPLAEVCRIVRGVTYNKAQASDAPEPGYIPVLRANNIQPPALVHEDLVYVPESCVSPDQMIAAGDIVIAMSSGSRSVVGKAAQSVNQWAGSFGAFCGVLRPVSDVHAGFIGHFCRSKAYRDKTTELAAGVNINNLKPSHFSEIEIPVPPLAEQARIAQALDGLLAQVDTLKARLDALPALIKRFRQSVLSAASSGELMEADKPTSSNSIHPTALGETDVEIITGPFGSALHKHDYVQDGIPVINPMHISAGEIYPSQSTTISAAKAKQLSNWLLMEGDIVVGRRGEMGRAATYTGNKPMLCGTGSLILRSAHDFHPKYLELSIRSPQAINHFTENSVGTTMVNLNQQVVRDLTVIKAGLDVQIDVVRRVEQLFAFADQLEARLTDARARVDALTQSILAKAFRGELVPRTRPTNRPASCSSASPPSALPPPNPGAAANQSEKNILPWAICQFCSTSKEQETLKPACFTCQSFPEKAGSRVKLQ